MTKTNKPIRIFVGEVAGRTKKNAMKTARMLIKRNLKTVLKNHASDFKMPKIELVKSTWRKLKYDVFEIW